MYSTCYFVRMSISEKHSYICLHDFLFLLVINKGEVFRIIILEYGMSNPRQRRLSFDSYITCLSTSPLLF